MGTAPAEDYAPIAQAWKFWRAQVVADLGGGGALILAVLGLNLLLRGMLVDLDSSVDAAKPRFAEEDPSSQCELVAADLNAIGPCGRRCVYAQTRAAWTTGRGGNHDSQELLRGDPAGRHLASH